MLGRTGGERSFFWPLRLVVTIRRPQYQSGAIGASGQGRCSAVDDLSILLFSRYVVSSIVDHAVAAGTQNRSVRVFPKYFLRLVLSTSAIGAVALL